MAEELGTGPGGPDQPCRQGAGGDFSAIRRGP